MVWPLAVQSWMAAWSGSYAWPIDVIHVGTDVNTAVNRALLAMLCQDRWEGMRVS
jgi:hypothetical protein